MGMSCYFPRLGRRKRRFPTQFRSYNIRP
jgi:hypothetical protein